MATGVQWRNDGQDFGSRKGEVESVIGASCFVGDEKWKLLMLGEGFEFLRELKTRQ